MRIGFSERVSSRKAPPINAASAGRTPAKNAIASAYAGAGSPSPSARDGRARAARAERKRDAPRELFAIDEAHHDDQDEDQPLEGATGASAAAKAG